MLALCLCTTTDRRCFNWVIEVVLSLKCRSAYRVESSLNIFLADFPSPPEDSTAKGANSIDEFEVRFPKALSCILRHVLLQLQLSPPLQVAMMIAEEKLLLHLTPTDDPWTNLECRCRLADDWIPLGVDLALV